MPTEYTLQGVCKAEFSGLRCILCPEDHALLLHIENGSSLLAGTLLPPGACVLLGGGARLELYATSSTQVKEYVWPDNGGMYSVALLEQPPAVLVSWLKAPSATLPDELLSYFVATNKVPSPTLTGVREYIEQNYASPISLNGLAAHAGCSKYTLIRGFKAHWGCTPMEYLGQVRLRNAQRLLTSTYMGVELIAELCGYSSASYLIARFKKEYGQTPHAYRQGAAL